MITFKYKIYYSELLNKLVIKDPMNGLFIIYDEDGDVQDALIKVNLDLKYIGVI